MHGDGQDSLVWACIRGEYESAGRANAVIRMRDTKTQIVQSLSKLLSLPLAIARDAGSMKNFQFGVIRPHPSGKGTVGEYALHIQCPWRLTQSGDIVTGSEDYYEPAEPDKEVDLRDWQLGNLQRKRLGEVLRSFDGATRSWVNGTPELVVESVVADAFGGFELILSGDFRLQVFPSGSRGEYWRFFTPGSSGPHLVMNAGRISAATPSELHSDED